MHSLQGNVPGFHPCRSPRIIDQQQRDTLSGFHLHRSPRLIEQKQRDAHLERRRVHYTVLRDSMTEVEKEAVLKERRNAYRIWKTRSECGNTTEISEQLSITAPVRPQDHGAGTSITNNERNVDIGTAKRPFERTCRSPGFLNQHVMEEPGPSITGASKSITSTSEGIIFDNFYLMKTLANFHQIRPFFSCSNVHDDQY